MYYSTSAKLISSYPGDQRDLIAMDRAIARSYVRGGSGWLDDGVLALRTGLPRARVNNLARRYVRQAVLEMYTPVQCPPPCEEIYDPAEDQCPECHTPSSEASPNPQERYRVIGQPSQPMFDPETATGSFQAFISYRHNQASQLATDLYYALSALGVRVFLDSGQLPPGVDAERVFYRVASEAPYFLCLASARYFDSEYCKREIAHAFRSAQNVLLIDTGMSSYPRDMPWLSARPNQVPIKGDGAGLSAELEGYLVRQVTQQPTARSIHDFRSDACAFLLAKLGTGDLISVVNSLSWLRRININTNLDIVVKLILDEIGIDTTRLQELCAALGP